MNKLAIPLALTLAIFASGDALGTPGVLRPDNFKGYIDTFNSNDEEIYTETFRNADAWLFLRDNIPLFDCPDKTLEEIYYFRWWTYRKHVKQTPEGFVITEFLPQVKWAGKYNTINCPAAHHFYEGRWLKDPKYLNDYATFWLRKGGDLRSYSFWIADSLWNRYLVTGDPSELKELFPDLVANYYEWEKTHQGRSGLFWQTANHDGMEVSVGGNGYRATINSYMYGDARSIANIAGILGKADVADEFRKKADTIKQLVQDRLWDKSAKFFKTLRTDQADAKVVDVRELPGFTPWYFNLPDPGFEDAWKQIKDTEGFYASYGPTSTEQRHPGFRLNYVGHECQWNGPSWPFATAITLTAMANLLNNYDQNVVSKRDYVDILSIYAKSQHLTRDDGKVVPWIDEDLNPYTGDWMARTIMKQQEKGIRERGKDYNHSTFCDLIITGLAGLRPRADNTVEVNPLIPEGTWEYFCLDNIPYHHRTLTILYDRFGKHYGKGIGLRVLVDGKVIASSPSLARIEELLP
jgi:hypothetical protein